MEGNTGGEVILDGVVVTGVALEGVVNIVGWADSVDSEADTFDNPLRLGLAGGRGGRLGCSGAWRM